ncbi:hypothetical protein AFCDBAGC_4682 [Methylobacterium cerastii]|uniref:Uncharacterized protein n=1 Tax=Methylobacterium cerastii TaxID=932741 RepID=A0ABQ4QNG6_9HYPH|nr:hypothetical protein AFCDBAGC_4682 [Methylobacterium cerastii]
MAAVGVTRTLEVIEIAETGPGAAYASKSYPSSPEGNDGRHSGGARGQRVELRL